MFAECRHILPSGLKCKSPSLTNQPFCYFHSRLRRHAEDGTSDRNEILILPSLEDVKGIQIALIQVLNAVGSGRIDCRQGKLYLYGLQIATQLAKHSTTDQATSPVRSITCDNWGKDLALEETSCEPPRDCLACSSRDTCKIFENYESEVEELEQQLADEEAYEDEDEEEEIEEDEDEEAYEDEDDDEEEEEEYEDEDEDEDDDEDDDEDEEEYEQDDDSILEHLNAEAAEPPRSHTTWLASGHNFSRAERQPIESRTSAPAFQNVGRLSSPGPDCTTSIASGHDFTAC